MKVAVVGTGLIGTSIALGAGHKGHQVYLWDSNPDHVQAAIDAGAGLMWDKEVVDLIVVAVPPQSLAEVIVHMLRTNPQSTVMDVGSVKANLLQEVESFPTLVTRFVPSHPMAGREVSGPRGARADLFADRVWVVCPTALPDRVQQVRNFVSDLGASPVLMSAVDHDRAVATTSHATQLVSSALAAQLLNLGSEAVAISGQGLRDVTRLAGSDSQLWTAILAANAHEVAAVIRALSGELAAVAEELSLTSSNPETDLSITRQLLEQGRQGRERIPGRHGSATERLATVAVQVSDEPGALAQVFLAAGQLNINLLDVRIDHLWGRPSGLIELSVDPDQEHPLREGLLSQGFTVRA